MEQNPKKYFLYDWMICMIVAKQLVVRLQFTVLFIFNDFRFVLFQTYY